MELKLNFMIFSEMVRLKKTVHNKNHSLNKIWNFYSKLFFCEYLMKYRNIFWLYSVNNFATIDLYLQPNKMYTGIKLFLFVVTATFSSLVEQN
jgi:hypothetical protein